MGQKQITLQAAGLYTYPNNLSEIPPGGLLVANNTIIDKPGVIEPRRGIKYYGNLFPNGTDRAKQLMQYRERLLVHINNTLAYDDGNGNLSYFSGTYNSASSYRMKYTSARGNLYFTTDSGVMKISAQNASEFSTETGYIRRAGLPFPIQPTAELNFSVVGFLNGGMQCGYKVVFGYKDTNDNDLLGAPSSALVITNNSPTPNAAVNVSFKLPAEINTQDYYFRIYRTQGTPVASDIYRMVFQGAINSADVALGQITYTDKLSDELWFSGVPLYSNSTDEGPLQTNDAPPFAKDTTTYSNHTFYGDTRQQHQALFGILTVSGFTSGSTSITLTDGIYTSTYTYVGTPEVSTITTLISTSIPDRSFIKLAGGNNDVKVAVWFDRTGTSLPPTVSEIDGYLLCKIDASGTVSANDIANRIAIALIAGYTEEFICSPLANVVTITNRKAGSCDNIADSTSAPTGMAVATVTQGTGENASIKNVLLSTNVNPALAADETAKSLVRVINAQSNEFFTASYLPSGSADVLAGNILIRKKEYSEQPIYIGTSDIPTTSGYSPEINKVFTNIISTGATATIDTTINHELISKSNVFIFDANTTASVNGIQKISNVTAHTFQIPVNVTSVTTSGKSMTTNFVSNNYAFGNRLYYSKYNQPEAVPFANYFDIGSKDKPIERIVSLRESLFIFKRDGIYRLTGDAASNFSIAMFDNTNVIVAPDTAAVIDNQIFVFTTQGIIKVSEVGFEVMSLPVKEKFIPFITSNPNISTIPFGVAYQTDRAYLVWTVSSKLDTYPTVCYRYSLSTGSWTEWYEPKTCGLVLLGKDKLHLGSAINRTLEIERKDFNRFDYSDREIDSLLVPFALNGNIIKPTSFEFLDAEDVITQTQYVTIYQFNMLLRKLDLDFFTTNKNYYSTYKMSPCDSLESKMVILTTELNVRDPSHFVDTNGNTSYVFTPTSDFANIQIQYNKIIDRLNQSAAFAFINYVKSEGSLMFEAIAVTTDTIAKTATLSIIPQFMQGPLLFYKGIKTVIEYGPQTGGDPAELKQFYQGTWMFAYRSFYSAKVGYTSDLSMAYEQVTFYPSSSGVFGQFEWGSGAVWGGLGDRVQLRTYVPRDKQRARFLTCRLEHGIALESYESYGVSISFNDNSDRAYR
jgi:hypothetical protein